MPPFPATRATYGPTPELPTKKEKTLKLFSSNSIDNPPNPLKQGIPRNHKPEANLAAIVNFQALGQANH
jgi:hypothetical protein